MIFKANISLPLLESQSSNTLKREMASSFFLNTKETYATEYICIEATLALGSHCKCLHLRLANTASALFCMRLAFHTISNPYNF